jgi:hypothetical protein
MHILNDAAWFRGIYSFGRRVTALGATRRLNLRSCSRERVFEIADGQATEEGNAKRRFARRNRNGSLVSDHRHAGAPLAKQL